MSVNITKAWEGNAPRRQAFTFVGRPIKQRSGKAARCEYMITGFAYAVAEKRVVAHMLRSIGTRDINIYVTCP